MSRTIIPWYVYIIPCTAVYMCAHTTARTGKHMEEGGKRRFRELKNMNRRYGSSKPKIHTSITCEAICEAPLSMVQRGKGKQAPACRAAEWLAPVSSTTITVCSGLTFSFFWQHVLLFLSTPYVCTYATLSNPSFLWQHSLPWQNENSNPYHQQHSRSRIAVSFIVAALPVCPNPLKIELKYISYVSLLLLGWGCGNVY